MTGIGLILFLHATQPPGVAPSAIRRAFERAYLPMIDTLATFEQLRVAMHWSGPLLEWMEANAPAHLDRLLGLVREGRVEPVGGLYGAGLLPALPERDVVAQVQAMTRWWRDQADVRVRGAWLPYCGWDPSAARVLGRLGLNFTVLEDEQLGEADPDEGYAITEREGVPLAIFRADTRIADLAPQAAAQRILWAITARKQAGARLVTLALPVERFGAALDSSATACFGDSDRAGWVRGFFAELLDVAHWLSLVHFGTALDRIPPPVARAYPPPSVSVPIAVAAMGGAKGAAWRRLREAGRAVAATDPDHPLARAVAASPVPAWELTLANHPEVDRLHKRMLRASAEVARLRAVLRESGVPADDPRVDVLEDATAALWEGQAGPAYVMGADLGAQDPAVRQNAWRALIRAERLVASVAGERGTATSEPLAAERADHDCDGRPEIVVRTGRLSAVVGPGRGGSVLELEVPALLANILNVRTRREEPEHVGVRAEATPVTAANEATAPRGAASAHAGDTRPFDVDEPTDMAGIRHAPSGLAEHLNYDRHIRASFVDRFLGADATLEAVAGGPMPDRGDFAGAVYELIHLEQAPGLPVVLGLGRDGNVADAGGLRLVRVLKRFAFAREAPRMSVRYEVSNRFHDTVRCRFAVELNLGVDGLHPDARLITDDRRVFAPGRPGEIGDTTGVALVDDAGGWSVRIGVDADARVWFHPLDTVSRTPAGIGLVRQGLTVLVWWPLVLGANERRRFELALEVTVRETIDPMTTGWA